MPFLATLKNISAVFIAVFLVTALTASLASRIIARMQMVYSLLNILCVIQERLNDHIHAYEYHSLCVAIIIGVPAATPSEFRNTARHVFGQFTNRKYRHRFWNQTE